MSRFLPICSISFCVFLGHATAAMAADLAPENAPALTADQSQGGAENVARLSAGARVDDKIAEASLISDHPTFGYSLANGRTELVLSLSKIENIDIVSFVNYGAVGTVTIATSNSRLAVGSQQWRQIAKQDLTAKVTRIKLGPTEAKYVKFSFDTAKSGRIAHLAVYSTATLTVASTTAGGYVDGKDAKDFGDSKEAKEAAPPAEGPPPTLPDAPPFVFVPQLAQVSP